MSLGFKPSASKYFKDSFILFSFVSTIKMFLQFLTLDKINPQSRPIAPAPMIKILLFSIEFVGPQIKVKKPMPESQLLNVKEVFHLYFFN